MGRDQEGRRDFECTRREHWRVRVKGHCSTLNGEEQKEAHERHEGLKKNLQGLTDSRRNVFGVSLFSERRYKN
jgi:hypothetical protein